VLTLAVGVGFLQYPRGRVVPQWRLAALLGTIEARADKSHENSVDMTDVADNTTSLTYRFGVIAHPGNVQGHQLEFVVMAEQTQPHGSFGALCHRLSVAAGRSLDPRRTMFSGDHMMTVRPPIAVQ